MREYHDKCGGETSNSVFSSVEPEIRAIISFKVINWYGVTLLLSVESIVL